MTINKIFIAFGLLLLSCYIYINSYMYFCEWNFITNANNDNTSQTDHIERIIVLGDPQMEGDWRIKNQGKKGEYNIWFNDNYFKHIISNIAYYLRPNYVFVLGDLFSSQYIKDEEFGRRVERYRRIFSPLMEIQGQDQYKIYNITGNHDIGYAGEASQHKVNRFQDAFGAVNDAIQIDGHIIGILNSINLDKSKNEDLYYASWEHLYYLKELKESTNSSLIIMTHIPLYKSYFPSDDDDDSDNDGDSNETVTIEDNQQPEQLVEINTPETHISDNIGTIDNIDGIDNPDNNNNNNINNVNDNNLKRNKKHQNRNRNKKYQEDNPQVLFPNNHPKYKTMCTENYFLIEDEDGQIEEQSMLTKETSNFILEELKPIFIFNGHDHDGCIYQHSNNYTIEYTIRSMMGDYGGYSGLFEIKKLTNDKFEYSFKACPFTQTKFINILFGVTVGWLFLFIFNNILLYILHKFDRRKLKIKID